MADLHVGACGDGAAGRGVPQLVAWDLSALVRRGRSPDRSLALHHRDGLGDHGASPLELDPNGAQRGHLTEADVGVGEEEDSEAVGLVGALDVRPMLARVRRVAAFTGQVLDLADRADGEVPLLLEVRTRQIDVPGDVATEPRVADREVEDQGQGAWTLRTLAGDRVAESVATQVWTSACETCASRTVPHVGTTQLRTIASARA